MNMSSVVVSGVHHVTFPVSDLETGIDWFARVLRATHVPRLDHHEQGKALFAVIMTVPGLDMPIQLRRFGAQDPAPSGWIPVSFGVADRAELDRWVVHLDACGVEHSSVRHARVGHAVDFTTPDGVGIQLYTELADGLHSVTFVED
jgi:catechol 2,3-dioxygenase-like lactoylglutathione lyase family enzyme